jgi:hypothetical protein
MNKQGVAGKSPLMKSLNNDEYEMFSRVCDDIHRIANQIAPEDQDNTVNAMMGGSVQGCALALEDILNGGYNDFNQANALRQLVARWKELANEYYKRQTEINEQRAKSQKRT